MDHLPSDVVLFILRKLAAGGSISLLRALAPFHRAAAENPEIWKEAFWGSHDLLGEQKFPLVEHCWKEEFAELDAEIETVGGYRSLLTARLITQPKSSKTLEQRQPAWYSGAIDYKNFNLEKVIILARWRGRPALWGSYPRHVPADPSIVDTENGFVGVSLHPLTTVDLRKVLRNIQVPERRYYNWRESPKKDLGGLSLAVYVFYTSTALSLPGLHSVRRVQNWCGEYWFFSVLAPVSDDGTVHYLNSTGLIAPQHTNAVAITGVSSKIVFKSWRSPKWTFNWRDIDDVPLSSYHSLADHRAGLETLVWASQH